MQTLIMYSYILSKASKIKRVLLIYLVSSPTWNIFFLVFKYDMAPLQNPAVGYDVVYLS